jgi:GT2 family glycosyltransferase
MMTIAAPLAAPPPAGGVTAAGAQLQIHLPPPAQTDGTADVTVIIVNWNAGPLLRKCLEHLRQQTRQPAQVILVDNASSDQSWDLPDELKAWAVLSLQRMDSNLGFAAGNNHALKQCTTEFVALLNPDAFAANDWLEHLRAAADQYPEAAAFGSRQLCHESPGTLDGTGDCYHASGLAWRQHHGQAQTSSHLQAREIFAPCAAAALYRHSAVMVAGGFDESYFCYHEDVDLGFRLRLQGHTARYVPQAIVHHVGSATTGGKRSDFATYHGHRNMVWTFVKNMPSPLLWALLPLHFAANLAGLAWLALRGQGRTALRAKWHALRGLGAALHQRQAIQTERKATSANIWNAVDKSWWPRPNGRS